MFSWKTTTVEVSLLAAISLSAATPLRDSVPRERLVSNAELFQALDLQRKDFATVRVLLTKGDTSGALQALASYFRTRSTPRYFFTTSEFRHRLVQFRTGYPGPVKKILADAQLFIRTYGSDVDWRVPGKDKLGRAHTPNTVRFLARQSQAENIAFMYHLDHGKKSTTDFVMDQVRDFVSDYESGNTESGANDVFERFYGGHRARNWLSMHHILLPSSDYSWSDQILLMKVFLLHGARLIDVSEKFNWGNHQLVGLTGVYEISLMYPEFPVMREWNAKATKTIMEHLEKEIPADGFQCERASHYFKLDILNYFRVYRLSHVQATLAGRLSGRQADPGRHTAPRAFSSPGFTAWGFRFRNQESDGSVLSDRGFTSDARTLARSTTGALRTYWLYEAQHFSKGSLSVRFSRRSSFEIIQHAGKGASLTVFRSDADSRTKTDDGRWQSRKISIGMAVPISDRNIE